MGEPAPKPHRWKRNRRLLKDLANLGKLIRNAQQIGDRVQQIQAQMRHERVTGTSGGGMVKVEANGLGEILSLSIDPALVERQEREMIEDLVPAAVNQALAKAKEKHAEVARELTAGFDSATLDNLISKVTGTSPSND